MILKLAMAVCTIGLTGAGAAGQDASDQSRAMTAGLGGAWAGVLEYRDYGSDQRVEIPARLTIEPTAVVPGYAMRVEFTDPGRVIVSEGVVSFSGDTHVEVGVEENAEASTHRIAERRFEDSFDWTLVLIRESTDNGEPVEERITQVMAGDSFRSTKDVRPRGDESASWMFRNEIRVEREDPDASGLVGTWDIDLRPSADAEPYVVAMAIESVEGGALTGTFYGGSTIQNGRVSTAFGVVRFSFTTQDGTADYHTAGELRGGRVTGTTRAVGRAFLMPWRGRSG